jgi:hypothetical protein
MHAGIKVLVTSVCLTKRKGAVSKQIHYMLHMTIFMQLVAAVEEQLKFSHSVCGNTLHMSSNCYWTSWCWVGFEVPIAVVSTRMYILEHYQCFRGPCFLQLHRRKVTLKMEAVVSSKRTRLHSITFQKTLMIVVLFPVKKFSDFLGWPNFDIYCFSKSFSVRWQDNAENGPWLHWPSSALIMLLFHISDCIT